MPKKQFDETLLSLLACPKTHAPLAYDSTQNRLISKEAGLAFPIKDGIAILLIEDAQEI